MCADKQALVRKRKTFGKMRSELVLYLKIFKTGVVKFYDLVHSEYLHWYKRNERPRHCWNIRIYVVIFN